MTPRFWILSCAWAGATLAGCASNGQPPASSASAAPAVSAGKPAPLPKTRREDIVETLHGEKVADPYRWLEDATAPEVQAWMKARDEQARGYLGALPERDALLARYRDLLYVEQRSAPQQRGDRLFFSVKPADKEKTIHYWQTVGGAPKVLLDPNQMSDDGSVSVHSVVPSPEGRKVAYMVQANNADESTLHVMTVETGEVSKVDTIEHLRYTRPSWTPKEDGFYYTWLPSDPKIAPNERMGFGEIRYHALGTDPAKDRTVREKTGDASRWMSARLVDEGRFLVLTISRGWSEQDVYIMEPGAKQPAWKPLAVGTKSNYMVRGHQGVLYVGSNHEAPRWQIFRVDPNQLERSAWSLIVPQDEQAVLQGMSIVGGRLGLAHLDKATTKLSLRNLDGSAYHDVALPALGTASGFIGEADQDAAYFVFSSFNYPSEVYEVSVANKTRKLFAKADVPVKSEDFVVEQVFYPSKDGTKVSMFLVYDKKLAAPEGGLSKTKDHMVLMFAYGGFDVSLTPGFKPLIIPWLERGGVYAVPNLRGGGEYGEAWHKAGMLDRKQNVFDDHQSAVRWLQSEGYTKPDRTVIYGRSNGGLLMGAAMTQAPDMAKAVICGVPLLDMVRYHQFGVGRAWIPEYGTAEDPDQFKWLYAYSPYHRVKAGTDYPALLMLSADTDDRVDPLHARKFVAAIEAARVGEAVNLLRIETNSGHGGADMRGKFAVRMADMIGFALSEVGGE